MKAPKKYKLHLTGCSYGGRTIDNHLELDLEECRDYFGYTLEIGSSWDAKINKNAKTMRGLVNAINKSFAIKYGQCYSTYEELEIEK